MRPTFIQRLQHDKALCQSTAPQFVDTWNYITERIENIKGDGDVFPDGQITVDNSDPEHPVIRFNPKDSESEGTTGATLDLSVVTSISWDTSKYQIVSKGVVMTFADGLLSCVSEEQELGHIETTPWTGE